MVNDAGTSKRKKLKTAKMSPGSWTPDGPGCEAESAHELLAALMGDEVRREGLMDLLKPDGHLATLHMCLEAKTTILEGEN